MDKIKVIEQEGITYSVELRAAEEPKIRVIFLKEKELSVSLIPVAVFYSKKYAEEYRSLVITNPEVILNTDFVPFGN